MDNSELTARLVNEPHEEIPIALGVPDGADNASGQAWTKGEKQPNRCRDPIFAFFFYAQVVAIFVIGFTWGLSALKIHTDTHNDDDTNFEGIMYLCLIAGGCGIATSASSFFLMGMCAKFLIQFSLLFSVAMALVSGICAAIMGSVAGAIFGFIFFLISICYACAVWNRIPFAATNLETGLAAVRKNCGVTIVAYVLVALAFGYSIVWTLSLVGVYYETADCVDGVCTGSVNAGYVFLLFLAIFWTQQVVQNTTHVTVAGTVGTWWFDPSEASSCCSKAIGDSFFRATTFSFGSICFGSLLVAIIQATKALVQQARREGDASCLLCIAECLLACIEGLVEYFNKWAYIYVGLYGYSYLEAGKNVMTLFEQRGWTTIITDDLISNALSLMCLVTGILSGVLGVLVTEVAKDWFTGIENQMTVAFFVAFFVGVVVSSILMGVVDSSVNTVIVCFAEAPSEFEANHPELSEKMRRTWRETYPVASGF